MVSLMMLMTRQAVAYGLRCPRIAALSLLGLSLIVSQSAVGSTPAQPSAPTTLEQFTEAFKTISQFADVYCPPVPTSGSSASFTTSGEANASLLNLLKKLADLKIGTAAQYQNEHSQGLLRTQLADALKGDRDCRLHVFNTLVDILVRSLLPSQSLDDPLVGMWVPETLTTNFRKF